MRVVLLVIALCMLVNESSAAFSVEYSCSATNVLTFKAWGDTALKTVHAENKGADCGTAATGTGKTQFTLNGGIQTDKTDGTVDPTNADATNCGYSGSGNARSIILILSTTTTVTTSSGRTTITCTTGQPHSAVKSVSAGSVTGTPSGSVEQIIPGNPSLKVIANSVAGGASIAVATSIATVALGTDIKIVSVIDTSGTAEKVLLTACKARSAVGANPAVSLTLPTGCSDQSGDVFTADIAPTEATAADKHISISPVFKAFKTANADTLVIECTVKVCIANDNNCNIPTCPPAARRRRRSVETRPLGNGTLSAAVFLVTSGRTHDLGNGIHGDNAATVSNCLSHVSFISVVAILAVLLVVSLAVSVFFCSKLIRQNNNNQQKKAYPNPAYKA